jgi:hypothetical protein
MPKTLKAIGIGDIDIDVDRTLRSVFELCEKETSVDGGSAASLLAEQEMMLWSLLMGRYEMAEYFWQEGGLAIPNALLASRILLGLAEHEKLQSGSLDDITTAMLEQSHHFEQCAIGVLSVCYQTNADLAQDVLVATLKPYDWMGQGPIGTVRVFRQGFTLEECH